ncbi:MAG: hypothetical protein KHY35_23495 [Bacteroides thetaiotaomicron]|uniref:Uncharacterized protein n=1 Tax=Bacteroides thetaiotaomicron TaxID=818 RepID=A0A943HSH6_BACT4|nr:hypothetical protein [Bacteroides thetaiotaomicron]
MANSVVQFKQLLRFSGTFNIIGAFLLIIPKVYESYLFFFNHLNYSLGLGGNSISIPSDIFHTLFINTAGIDLVLIGIIVLLVSKDPLNRINRLIILCNGIGRSVFAVIIGYYAISQELIRIFVVIGAIDFLITVGFMYYLLRTKPFVKK